MIYTNIEQRKTSLEDYLATSLTIERSLHTIVVNVTNCCNLSCSFCPNGNPDFKHPNSIPSFIDISIIDILVQQTKDKFYGEFSISGFGEPLLHPEIEAIVEKLNTIGQGVTLYTNGTNPKRIKQIAANRIKIDTYNEATYAACKDIFANNNAHVKINQRYKENDTFYNNRAGNVSHSYNTNDIPNTCCYIPFMKITLDTDGTLLQCCSDWSRKFPLGNIKKDNLWNIWNGELEKKERLYLIANERNKCVLCKTCNSPGNLYGEEFKSFWEEHYGEY